MEDEKDAKAEQHENGTDDSDEGGAREMRFGHSLIITYEKGGGWWGIYNIWCDIIGVLCRSYQR